MASKPQSRFTGRHMAVILIVGFGIVAAVNFYMASLAAGGFHGVVVTNSYVASQKYNQWLEEAEAAKALGWAVEAARDDDGHVVLKTNGVPEDATVTAELRRPIGAREYASLGFAKTDEGSLRSFESIADGRWTMRLFIEAGSQKWAEESELK